MKQQERYIDQTGWDKVVAPITLKMKKGEWEIFKEITPRNIKLNEAVMQLIRKKIVEESEEVSEEDIKEWNKDQEYWASKKKARLKFDSKS